jgi:hypothetical protein
VRHLVRRIVWSLQSHRDVPAGQAALLERLSPAESVLYHTMQPVDRDHAVQNAGHCLGAGLSDEWVVAAALHDVGKIDADLGTFGRIIASVVMLLVGRRRTASLRSRGGMLGRIGAYAAHPDLGAAMLAEAGSDPVVVTWAATHHGDLNECGFPPRVVAVLWRADQV